MSVLPKVHDLIISYPDDVNVSALNVWFNTAHDAGVRKYILEKPFQRSGNSVRVQTSQLHILNIKKRLQWLGGNIQVCTPTVQSIPNVEVPGELRSFNSADQRIYQQELKTKLRFLRNLRARLLNDELDGEKIELHGLSVIIHRLGSRRNALSPISRLPPELLCHIFAFASRNAETYREYPPSLAWVKVSHVCGYWREVSRNNPATWSHIPAFVLQWTQEMLKRSKSSPLHVYYNEEEDTLLDHPDYSALTTALGHLDRITDLSISTNAPYLDIPIANPAPILERFSLLMHSGPRGAPIIPTIHLFSGMAPRLRHMALGGACFDLRSSLFQNLTSLELSNIGVRAPGTVNSTEILINLFAGMPKLETLHLCDALPRVDPRGFSRAENRANLPSLTTLQIRDSLIPNILDFSSRISIANETRGIPLVLGFGVNSPRDLLRPLFADIERLCRLRNRPFRSVRISRGSSYDFGLLIEGWSSIDGPINTTLVPDLSLDLRLGDSDHDIVTTVLGRVFSALPFSGTLVVAVHCIDLRSAWRSVIKPLRNVHTIYLNGCPPASLLSSLVLDSNMIPTATSVSDPRPNFLPDLRILLFRRVFFGNKMKYLATLAKVLLHRQQLPNSAVIQLQFDQCRGMTEAHALVFQKVVPNVAWTEMKAAESDEEEYDDDSQSDD
ncbi:hypothetical protein BDZ94DRAFT_1240010 [Collybia nuda]|uniref:F-box domain-containing protein n=1 Tax=Collybia nuda TaxID=64659 RepID=A0A9P5XZA3_9AGAR|nr:hypothetical protein BDZ94DRAFT_1240010 [Collybia nuda]